MHKLTVKRKGRVVILFNSIFVVIGVSSAYNIIASLMSNPLSSPSGGEWNWASASLASAIVLGLPIGMLWNAICEMDVQFTTEGCRRRTVWGGFTSVRWGDIQLVETHYPLITLRTQDTIIAINTLYFDLKELTFMIQNHVPPDTLSGRPAQDSDFD